MYIILVIVALIAALLTYAGTRPDSFVVSRSVTINASPETIFPLIDNFQSWANWSPYEKLDPAMKKSFLGPASGKGAAYAWEGNGKAGKGRMEIVQSVPSSQISLKLDFEKPFRANNAVDFTLRPAINSMTEVSWTMRGASPFVTKLFGIFINLDRMIGRDFETGLANLKAIAEG